MQVEYLDGDRDQAIRALDELETLARWLLRFDQRAATQLEGMRRKLSRDGADVPELARIAIASRDKMYTESGCLVTVDVLKAPLDEARSESATVGIPLWYIERYLFQNYRDYCKLEASVRNHVTMKILPIGCYPTRTYHWSLAEVEMYEDMAMAANELVKLGELSPDCDVLSFKRQNWLARSTVLSAFYFLEAYLNGLAVHFLAGGGKASTDNGQRLLEEWDRDEKKRVPVTFKEKLCKYPRIIKGDAHSPLQESNDEDVRDFLGVFRRMRDACVHASHRRPEKVADMAIALLDPGVSIRCADAAVRLVRKIDSYVSDGDGWLETWLYDRDKETGCFPDEAFV